MSVCGGICKIHASSGKNIPAKTRYADVDETDQKIYLMGAVVVGK